MHLSVCGLSHKTATLADREAFQLGRLELMEATKTYAQQSGCLEAAVVATCNRVEFFRVSAEKSNQIEEVAAFYRRRGSAGVEKLPELCYYRQGTTAARHLFRVAAGLDSMVLGEDQVFHQLKDAYSAACAVGGPGKILHKLFHLAFAAGKRVRSETEIGSGPRSVSGAALELLKDRLNGRLPAAALVCGVNEMTEILLDGLSRWEIPVILANRSVQKAERLAAAFKAKSLPIEEVGSVINKVDVLFSATAAPSFVITRERIGALDRRNHPLYILDLAIPRDVEPELGDMPGVFLFDQDDIRRYLEHCEDERRRGIPAAESIIEEQVKAYSAWRSKEKQQEKVLELHRELNRMRRTEMEKFKEGFHPGEYRALDAFSQALVRNFMRMVPGILGDDKEEKRE
jgi:glutamyl-tRNA reductase